MTTLCTKCNRLIRNNNFKRHSQACIGKSTKNWFINEDGDYICNICGKKSSSAGIGNHIKYHFGYTNPITKSWNTGLTKESDDRIAKYGQTLRIGYRTKTIHHPWLGRHLEEEHKQKISKKLSINNKGGRCNWFEVEGQKVQGTWEKNLAEHMTKLKITWQKLKVNNYTLKFIDDENKVRSYTPDFLIENTHLLEVKGFWWGDDERKMQLVLEQTNTKIFVIRKQKYKELLKIEDGKAFLDFLLSD